MITNKNYKINFTEYQKNILATVDFNGDKRNKVMSVLSYVIKHSIDGVLSKSINRLYAMYIRYHQAMSLSYFKKLINVLAELNLISKENRVISIVAKKVAKKVANSEVAQTTEDTGLEVVSDLLKDKGSLNNYTIYTSKADAKQSAPKTEEEKIRIFGKVMSKDELKVTAVELLKELKVKSKVVRERVMKKIDNSNQNINEKGATRYISFIIAEIKQFRELENHAIGELVRNRKFRDKRYAINPLRFNNFESREYDYDALERQLLGWDEPDLSACTL